MQKKLDYIDISPVIREQTGVFPGDVPYRRHISMDLTQGHHLTLSSITTTLHIGAHVDAPNHYEKGGQSIAERELHYYMGLCEVVTVKVPFGERILLRHLETLEFKAPRVIFRTQSFLDPDNWNSEFCSLSEELIEHLAKAGVILVGIDTPSIDPEDAKVLQAHNAVARNNMAIIEGVVLSSVGDGLYSLMALPLRLEGADASPVRAILFRDPYLLP